MPTEELSQLFGGQLLIEVIKIYRYSNVAISAQKWQQLNAHRYSALSELIVLLYFLLVMICFIENTPACGTLVSTSSSAKMECIWRELPRITIINLWLRKVCTASVPSYL